jgi:NADPH2 dehydrogenase
LAEWFEETKSAGAETSIRISLRTGDPGFDTVGRGRFHDRIVRLPTTFIDVSSGYYNIDKQLIYPARPDTLQARRAETLSLAAQYPEAQFILSGRALMESEEGLPSNAHIGLCRDLIANPDFLENQAKGCINSGECHYFSRGATHISCPQWKRAVR